MVRKTTRLLFFTLLQLYSSALLAQSYPYAILAGDYPDPTILRDGKDFYMTHSPSYYFGCHKYATIRYGIQSERSPHIYRNAARYIS